MSKAPTTNPLKTNPRDTEHTGTSTTQRTTRLVEGKKITEIGRSKIIKTLESEKKKLVGDAMTHRKPVKPSK